MQSTASSAAYATGNMVVGVFPAMLLLSVSPARPGGIQAHWFTLAAWIACVAALGVTLAIPLKRQLINRERLAFPSGTAAAIMLDGLHRTTTAVRARTRTLFAAIALGAVLPVLRDLRGWAVIGPSSKLFDWLPRISAGGHSYAASDAGLVLRSQPAGRGRRGVRGGWRTTVVDVRRRAGHGVRCSGRSRSRVGTWRDRTWATRSPATARLGQRVGRGRDLARRTARWSRTR